MAERPNTIQLEIFGQPYAVRAGQDPGYIEHLAAYVDAQMREVSRAAGAVDSMKIAVLAALNVTDELFKAKLEVHQASERLAKLESDSAAARQELESESAARAEAAEQAATERVKAAEKAAAERVSAAEAAAAERVRAVETMSAQRVREAEGRAGDRAEKLARVLDEALAEKG
jgi:cell division protein ZapA